MIYDIQSMIQGIQAQEKEEQDNMLPYLKALKFIMGADGEIADAEWKAFQKEMKRLKVSADLIQEITDFEIENVELKQILPELKKDSTQARMLLRDAIHISMADSFYAPEERASVHQAAKLLGVETYLVKSLEALVEMEYAANHLKNALL